MGAAFWKCSSSRIVREIMQDWKVGDGNQDDSLFDDILCSLPISCIVCNHFMHKEVGKIVEMEVQCDYV